VIFAYFGTEIVAMAAAESRQPARAIPRATSTIVWRIMIFYVGSVATIVVICVALGAMSYMDGARSQLLLGLVSVAALFVALPFARRSRQRLLASACTGSLLPKCTGAQGVL
jgi:L-asparagine transporter-like permease